MNLFVTGASSFVGKVFVAAAKRAGHSVVGVDIAPGPGVTPADIRSPDIVECIPEGTDAVIHLAAISRDKDCKANPTLAMDVNVMGTLNLVEKAKQRGVRQFVFASSEWVYGDAKPLEVQRETQAVNAFNVAGLYALTKLTGEQILRLSEGFEATTVLRFSIIYGDRHEFLSAVEQLFLDVQDKEVVTVGSRSTGRRFIHVDDIVSGILAALGRTGFEIFNLSGDRVVTMEEIVQTSARILGRDVSLHERAPEQVSVRNPDNSAARNMLGWRPTVDLYSGLTRYHDFLKAIRK